jgi:hypothetical protein
MSNINVKHTISKLDDEKNFHPPEAFTFKKFEQIRLDDDKLDSMFYEKVEAYKKGLKEEVKSSEVFSQYSERQEDGTYRTYTLVPGNFYELAENSDFWLAMHKCMTMTGSPPRPMPEVLISPTESESVEWKKFTAGLLISLGENTINKTNYRTKSSLERARLLGQYRRVISLCSTLKVPIHYTKHGKYDISVSQGPADPLWKMIDQCLHHRDRLYANTFCRLYTSAQSCLARETDIDTENFVMTFQEAWHAVSDNMKTPSGEIKRNKDGSKKKFQPSRPRFAGMTREETEKSKVIFGDLLSAKEGYNSLWSYIIKDQRMYVNAFKDLRNLYVSQCSAVSAVRGLAFARVESLGLRPNAPKSQISNRISQRKASENYLPVFSIEDLKEIAENASLTFKGKKRVSKCKDDEGKDILITTVIEKKAEYDIVVRL